MIITEIQITKKRSFGETTKQAICKTPHDLQEMLGKDSKRSRKKTPSDRKTYKQLAYLGKIQRQKSVAILSKSVFFWFVVVLWRSAGGQDKMFAKEKLENRIETTMEGVTHIRCIRVSIFQRNTFVRVYFIEIPSCEYIL